MIKSLGALFLGLIILAFGYAAYLRLQERLSEIASAQVCKSESAGLALKQPGEFPLEETPQENLRELRVVKSCQGQTSRDMIDESGEKFSAPVPRTILFFSAGPSTPDIITARITNAERLREYGVAFEHGSLNDLRSIQSAEFGSRFDALLIEAADLCLGAYSDYRQYEIDFLKLREEIESQSTAFLSMDFDIQAPDTQVTLYYKIDNEIFQRDLSQLLNPI